MANPGLILLSTDHCSACEQALEVLLSMPELNGLGLDVIDVAADDELLDAFGERVPVLGWRGPDGELAASLDWPFGTAELSAWLRQLEQTPGILGGGVDDAP